MNPLVRQFFNRERESGDVHFFETIWLQEEADWDWEMARRRSPQLPRPWFELSRLSPAERIEFVSALWLDRFPYHPSSHAAFIQFFRQLDDIGIILHRQSKEEPLLAEMVYSLADNSTFFRGLPPCAEEELRLFRSRLPFHLPRDFQTFFSIHHGFGKLSELGLLQMDAILEERESLVDLLIQATPPLRSGGHLVDPHLLIPFYEAFGLASYQCFYADWYPSSEMGNVYFSGIDYTISDITERKSWMEQLAFPTFLEWFVYYLEGNVCI